MADYVAADLHITKSQREAIAKALEANTGVILKFTYKQLADDSADNTKRILLTKTQHARLAKQYAAGKGLTISLTRKQLNKMKTGGFLPMLLAGVASALAPVLFGRLFPDKQSGEGINLPDGDGIHLPGGDGINLPGAGGINLPGTGRRQTRTHPAVLHTNDKAIVGDNGQPGGLKVTGSGVGKKKRQTGGYLDPMSAKFQMLQ